MDATPYKIISLIKVASSPVKDMEAVSSLPYVGVANIQTGTGFQSDLKTVGELGIKGPAFRFSPRQLVYSKIRPSLRKCFLATFEGVCSADIYPLEVNTEKVVPEYLFAVLVSRFFANIAGQFDQRAGIPKINRDQLYGLTIPLPTKEEQTRLAVAVRKDLTGLEAIQSLEQSARAILCARLDSIWSE